MIIKIDQAKLLNIQNSEAEKKRQAAYTQEADPLFFKWRAGEGTEEAWLQKRQEIREKYPYQEETI